MDYNSITKSTYIEEGLDALRTAKRVNTKSELKEQLTINQNSDASRSTCWGQINKRYLDYDEDKVIKTPLLKLIDVEGHKLNQEIMYYNYLQTEPIAKKTVLELVYPKLLSEGDYKLSRKDVIYFINNYLDNHSQATINKTARSIVKALIDFGLAKAKNKDVIICYYSPSITSFLYGFYAEYSPGYPEANKHSILNPSLEHIKEKADFYKLFLIKPSLVESYLQLSWEKGFLNYEPMGGLNQYVLKHENTEGLVNYLLNKGVY